MKVTSASTQRPEKRKRYVAYIGGALRFIAFGVGGSTALFSTSAELLGGGAAGGGRGASGRETKRGKIGRLAKLAKLANSWREMILRTEMFQIGKMNV